MTLRKQAVALLLAVLMLVSNIPVALATGDTTSPEFPDYTAQLYSKPFDQANPTANLVKDGDQISKYDTLYYVIEKAEMVSQSGPSENDVIEGETYQIPLPAPLCCAEAYTDYEIIAEYPREDGSNGRVSVGTFSMQAGADYITVCFEIPDNPAENPDQVILEQLTDFHLSFACKLDEKELAEQVDGQGQLTMELPGDQSLQLIIEEMLPVAPVAPKITKTNNGKTQQEETTWTITYTPSNETYTGTKPTQLVDTLPAGMQLVEDSVTITPEDGAVFSASPGELTFEITGDVPVKISYRTKFASETWIEIFQKGTWTGSFLNSVQGCYTIGDDTQPVMMWGEPVTSRVSKTIHSELLSKNSSDIDYDPATGIYSATWTISVRPQGQTLDCLVLKDTMGDGLILPDDLGNLNMAIHYPGDSSSAPVIPVDSTAIQRDGQILTIDLTSYLDRIGGNDFDLKYTTQVNGDTLQTPPVNLELYKNSIQAEIEMGEQTFTTLPITYVPENVEQVLITHRGVAANTQERTLTWETTINPKRSGSGWDLPSPNLTEIVYRDELPKAKPSENNSAWHSFGWTEEMREQTVALVQQNVKAALLSQNLPETALQSVTVTEKEDNWVLEVKLSGTGDKPITFQYKTYAQDPKFWAANKGSSYYYKNTVGLVAGGTKINNAPLAENVFSNGNITIGAATVLRKWPMNAYNPTQHTLTWELFINERAANLGTIKIEELLPAGMTYVPGSARIGYDRNNGTSTQPLPEAQVVNTPDEPLTFFLKDVTTFCRLQFDVEVDVEQLTQTTTAFQNSAKLFVIDEAAAEKPWVNTASATETAKLVNRLLTKTSSEVTGTGANRAVTYTVKLNPMGMDLANLIEDAQNGVYLTDTLDTGLVLDVESVKLYEGIVETAAKPNSYTHTYTPEVKQGTEIVSPDISFDAWENQLRVHIPDPTKSYYLTYTAYVVTANITLDNKIMLEGSTLQAGSDSFGSANAAVKVTVGVGIKLRPPANKYFSVAVEKIDAADSSKLSGAEFGLYTTENDESSLVTRGVTGTDGTCVLSVPISDISGKETVYIKEITAPDGYLMDRDWHGVSVQNNGEITTLTVKNTKLTQDTRGRAEITVDIESDTPLDPWEITKFPFLVYEKPDEGGALGEPIGPIYPNRDGKLIIDGLNPEKDYLIVPDEEHIPNGYQKPSELTLTLENGSAFATITIQQDDTEDPSKPEEEEKPTEPDGGDPEPPDGGDPEQPGGGDPEQPGGGDPEQPGGGDPEQPDSGDPEQPGSGDPEQPGGGDPGQPDSGDPEQPDSGDPGQSDSDDPEQPDGGDPGQPDSGDPEQPGGDPAQPSDDNMQQNGQQPEIPESFGSSQTEETISTDVTITESGSSAGSAQGTIPKTGVESRKELWLAGSAISLAMALGLLLPNKKKQNNTK